MPKSTKAPLHYKRSTTDSDSALAALKRILKSAPQDLWLDTIRRADIKGHGELICWMLDQTECDFAIAVHAFYHSDPAYHLDNPRPLPARSTPGQVFGQVLINWDKGYYRFHNLQIEMRDAHPRVIARINQKSMARPRGSLPFTIPARLLDPTGGKALHLPSYMSPDDAAHLWPIYNALGLQVPATAPGLSRRMAKARAIIDRIVFRTNRS